LSQRERKRRKTMSQQKNWLSIVKVAKRTAAEWEQRKARSLSPKSLGKKTCGAGGIKEGAQSQFSTRGAKDRPGKSLKGVNDYTGGETSGPFFRGRWLSSERPYRQRLWGSRGFVL